MDGKTIAGEAVVANLAQPIDGVLMVGDGEATGFENIDQVRMARVVLCKRSVHRMFRYKRRRGLVRFRKPESRAAHCRSLYGCDLRVTQVEIFHLTGEGGVGIISFLLIFSHWSVSGLQSKKGVNLPSSRAGERVASWVITSSREQFLDARSRSHSSVLNFIPGLGAL